MASQIKEKRVRAEREDDPNALGELGEKIFLDRYALKDVTKRTLGVGDTVVVCVDMKTGQREARSTLLATLPSSMRPAAPAPRLPITIRSMPKRCAATSNSNAVSPMAMWLMELKDSISVANDGPSKPKPCLASS